MITNKLQKFLHRYQINVLNTNKRCVKYVKPTSMFMDPLNSNTAYVQPNYETEPMLTVEIPLSHLENIAELELTFYNSVEDVERRRYFERHMRQLSEEKYLQDKFPAVKQAHEAYSLMLHLCSENPYKPK